MKRYLGVLIVAASLSSGQSPNQKFLYPTAKKGNVADDYHGTKVADPYRWLEDTNASDTAEWVAAENKITEDYLKGIPQRARLLKRLTQLADFERYTNAFQYGGRYFVFHNNGLQNQDVLFTMDSVNGKERVLLDPNVLRADGTAALSGLSVSEDGKLVAYAIAQAGSDWSEWRIRSVETGKDLPDLIQWTKFSTAAWTPDNQGFFYQRFPEPRKDKLLTDETLFGQIYYHRLGEAQSKDKLIYERPDKKSWFFQPGVSEDGRYLILSVHALDFGRNMLYYQDLKDPNGKMVELIDKLTAAYEYLGNDGTRFYLQTTDEAPNGRIITIDIAHPERSNWKQLVAQQPEVLKSASIAGGYLILNYLKDAHARVNLHTMDGKFVEEMPLPGIGTIDFSSNHSRDTELFYSYATYTSPPPIYRYDLKTHKSFEFRKSKLSFDPALYETKQVFYKSKDGTRIPMFLSYKKGMQLNGLNPTLLYGYGGFNVAMTPAFAPSYLTWMEMGGIFAVANLRGGSEYGEEWHQAGMKLKKQNVFDDFIAAAEYLIANKYTSKPKLAIFGGSNGGLLVGACLNQRPDLFGAAMPAVGVMDMLRFHKFTVGATWTGDYGSPDNPEEYKAIRAYSPLHNIKPGTQYPPTLITTSDHDDRVVPGHSFKYAAALQAAQEGPAPILIRIETRAGHGAGKPTTKRLEEFADRLAFLVKSLNIAVAAE